jgi:RNA-binding protein NOB1
LEEESPSSMDVESSEQVDDGKEAAKEVNDDEEIDDSIPWITPENISEVLRKEGVTEDDSFLKTEDIQVGCVTVDFAMQNVLLQMGLNLVAVNGKRIRQARRWMLRCYACHTCVLFPHHSHHSHHHF